MISGSSKNEFFYRISESITFINRLHLPGCKNIKFPQLGNTLQQIEEKILFAF
jgi:hypothetical protein